MKGNMRVNECVGDHSAGIILPCSKFPMDRGNMESLLHKRNTAFLNKVARELKKIRQNFISVFFQNL